MPVWGLSSPAKCWKGDSGGVESDLIYTKHFVRSQGAFQERHDIHLSGTTIWEWLEAEGLEWKRQKSWFHEAKKHNPEFVEISSKSEAQKLWISNSKK